MQLQCGRTVRRCRALGVNGLLQIARQTEGTFGVTHVESTADGAQLAARQVAGIDDRFDSASLVNPTQTLQFGVTADQGFGATLEVVCIDLMVGEFAADAHQLLLALQQAQAQALLRVFDIALDSLLFAVDFFQPQIAKGSHDGGQKQQHSCQRRQHGKAVLALRRLASPPAPPARQQRQLHRTWQGSRTGQWHGIKCR